MSKGRTLIGRSITIIIGVGTALTLAYLVVVGSGIDADRLKEIPCWFDPIFFLYNLGLAVLAVIIVPLITHQYIRSMKDEKVRRIEHDLNTEELEHYRPEIERLVPAHFSFARYRGSMIVLMMVIASGACIILLLKPYFPLGEGEMREASPPVSAARPAESGGTGGQSDMPTGVSVRGAGANKCAGGLGVDYGRGANMLLLGPFIEMYRAQPKRYFHQIVISLTAFQFGFLGAYVYFIGYLLRAYFILDLTRHTFVAGSIRMVTSSLLALVLSFALPTLPFFGSVTGAAENELFLRYLPLLAFCLGYFPNRALFLLDKWTNSVLGFQQAKYAGTPLATLAGMSPDHESRLDREGYDNLENLSHARAIDLAVRTGFSYRQLRHWIEEAKLRLHLGADYEEFVDRTGIRTSSELLACWQNYPDAVQRLEKVLEGKIFTKVAIVSPLLLQERLGGQDTAPLPEPSGPPRAGDARG
jgi:hypothetical protein